MKTVASSVKARMPLNTKHLRVLTLLILTIGQCASIANSCSHVYSILQIDNPFAPYALLIKVGLAVGTLTVPLLLLVAMTQLLQKRVSIIKVLISFLVGALALNLAYVLAFIVTQTVVYSQMTENTAYLVRKALEFSLLPGFPNILARMVPPEKAAMAVKVINVLRAIPSETLDTLLTNEAIDKLLAIIMPGFNLESLTFVVMGAFTHMFTSFANKNIFQDMLLFSAIFWFIVSKPKNLKGGKLLVFRLGAAIPLVYFIVGYVINIASRLEWYEPGPLVVLLSPTHSLGNWVLFAAVIFFRKYQELEFANNGGLAQDLDAYLMSDRGAYQMSVFIAFTLCVISFADVFLCRIPGITAWGIGSCKWFFIGAPIVLLFNSARYVKYRWYDHIFFPAYYIANYVFVAVLASNWFETIYHAVEALLNEV